MENNHTPSGEGKLPAGRPLSPLAQDVRKALKIRLHHAVDSPAILRHQSDILDSLFTTMLLDCTAQTEDEQKFHLAVAMRAQRQCLDTIRALFEIKFRQNL